MQYNSKKNAAPYIEKLGNGYDGIVRKTVLEALEKKFGAEKIADVTVGLGEEMNISVEYSDLLEGVSVGDTVDNALTSLLRG